MARHAVINKDGLVVNVIEWDGVAPWWPPKDCTLLQSEIADRNDFYDRNQKVFVKKDPIKREQ